MKDIIVHEITFNIGHIKVMHISGTSSLIVGNTYFEKQSSHSKTNNGVGSAYGDEAEIEMMPYKANLYDGDYLDNPQVTFRRFGTKREN